MKLQFNIDPSQQYDSEHQSSNPNPLSAPKNWCNYGVNKVVNSKYFILWDEMIGVLPFLTYS